MLTDAQIEVLIAGEEMDAIGYSGVGSAIQSNRALFLDYYNQLPFGDEQEGMSSIVTSDVYDVIEGMIPPLLRFFTQDRHFAKFSAEKVETPQQSQKIAQAKAQGQPALTYEEKAEQKTVYSNHVFNKNDGVKVLYNMIKDGLLQYTGWIKVYQDESVRTVSERYTGLSEIEVEYLNSHKDVTIVEKEADEHGLYDIRIEVVERHSTQVIENIPPEETLISKRARSFKNPNFIGQRTPKTRSELIEMGFKKDVVMKLDQDSIGGNIVTEARNHNTGGDSTTNQSTNDKSQDQIYLGEYYMHCDVDEDGVSELWQFFYAGNTLLKKTRVDKNPYCVFVPTPIPHRAIGTCPAEHVAPVQYWRSTLVRQMNNNIYATNFNRVITNDNVNLDDVLNVQHGGVIRVDGIQPVTNAVQPFMVQNQVPAVLEAIQYADTQREQVSGVTAYNQGMDTESLNKTATGFTGVRDMSMMRIEVIARHAAETIKDVFERIVENAQRYQDETMQIKVMGQLMEIDPRSWANDDVCVVDSGSGAGDKQQKIQNLNFILQMQKEFMQTGLPLSSPEKIYHALDKLCIESDLKDAAPFFNDPSVPVEAMQAENQQLKQQVQQMQEMMDTQNQFAEAEKMKGEYQMAQQKQKQQHEMNMKMAEMGQKGEFHKDDLAVKLTDLEIKANKDVKGSLI